MASQHAARAKACMVDTLRKVIQLPYYLWIVGLIPILHLYQANFGLVRDCDAVLAALGMLAATSALFLLASRFVRDPHQRAFYLCLTSLVFSLSGHVYEITFMPKSLLVWTLLAGAAYLALLLCMRRLFTNETFSSLTPAFNLAACTLLAMQLISLLSHVLTSQANTPLSTAYRDEASMLQNESKVMDSATRPDIYYIIPDGYPSDAELLSQVGYDNTDFTKSLLERGFTVAPQAQSNYAYTVLSLPSILNMKYFDENPTQFSDLDYLQLLAGNNTVARRLKQLGYTYVQLLSGYFYISPIADIVRDFSPAGPIDLISQDTALSVQDLAQHGFSEDALLTLHIRQPFIPLYLDTTALRIVRSHLEKLSPTADTTPFARKTAERFLMTIDSIDSIVKMPEATFTIMHLLEPYGSVNFNEYGDIIPRINEPSSDEFLAELPFLNSRFLQVIDTILQESQNPPVIIFQADHGSYSLWRFGGRTDDAILYDSYASYHLPDAYAIDFPAPFTLVNAFPLILNEVFGMDLELQGDRILHVDDRRAPFEQVEVTEAILNR